MNFRTDINGLRAVAVVAVVLFHYHVPGFAGGFVGVDVFFVISGFLMSQAVMGKLERGTFSLGSFYAARARRILPALLVLQAVLLVYGLLRLLPSDLAELAKSIASSATFISNIVFWQEMGYFDTFSQEKWLLHTWSLSVEWQFYLLFPLFLAGLYRIRAGRFLGLGVALALVLSLGLSVAATPWKPSAAFYLLPTRAWEMLAGTLVYLYPVKLPRRNLLAYGGLATIAACLFFYDEASPYPGYRAALPVLGAMVVLAANGEPWLLRSRIAQYLGDTSYSLYLWHWPFTVAARHWELTPGWPSRLGLIAASLAFAHASYVLVETRARKAERSGNSDMLPLVLRGGLVAALGLGTFLGHGLPVRLPELAAQNDAVSAMHAPVPCESRDPICRIGAADADAVLVWGDSHANHLYPVMSALQQDSAKKPKLLFGSLDACIPVRGVADANCARHNQQIFERAQQPDVHSVVLASIWTPYFRENPYDSASLPTLMRETERGWQRFATAEEGLAFVEKQLREDLIVLTAKQKRVFLVLPVPTYMRSVAKYMALQTWHDGPIELSLEKSSHERATGDLVAMLRRVSAATGATVLEPASVLCPEDTCNCQLEQVAIYSDNNHLAPRGALLLTPLLRQTLEL